MKFHAAVLVVGACVWARQAIAQTAPPKPQPVVVSACDFPGATPDAQIAAAFAALPKTGGIVDDRCHSGPQTWKASPFVSIQRSFKPVTLLLGPARIVLDTPGTVSICTSCRMEGLSRNATLFVAGPNFPQNTPMFTMGDYNPSYDVVITRMGISTNGETGVTAIYNSVAEERSTVTDVSFYGLNGGAAVDIETNGAQNSGPYENLEILVAPNAVASTAGIRVRGTFTRAIRGITVNASGTSKIAHGIEIGPGQARVEDYHCEFTVDCLYLDGTDGVVAIGIYGSDNPNTAVTNAVHITPNNQFVTLIDINKGGRAGANLQDDLNGVTERGAAGLGFYATGFTSGGKSQSIISSSSDVSNYTKSWKLFPNSDFPACASAADTGKTVLINRSAPAALGYCTPNNSAGFNLLFAQMEGEYDQLSPGSAVALDTSRGSLQYVTLGSNSVGAINAGSIPGQQATVQICNGPQNYSWSWPSNVRGGGMVNTGPNHCQSQTFAWNGNLREWIPTGPISGPF